jgi:hypothetical protein
MPIEPLVALDLVGVEQSIHGVPYSPDLSYGEIVPTSITCRIEENARRICGTGMIWVRRLKDNV